MTFLRLSRAALRTFVAKIRRDGVLTSAKALYALVIAESPAQAIARHSEVVALFERPSLAALKPLSLANKYLSNYMAKSLGKQARREILLHHYRRIDDQTSDDFHARITADPCILWRTIESDDAFAIALAFNTPSHIEGDLSVVFLCGEKRIFEISFAIVPGAVIGSARKELLLVGRVQGVKDELGAIRRAAKACHDVAPQYMLMLAAQSIAQVIGIPAIAGINNDDQLFANRADKYLAFDYNAFWETLLSSKTARDFYEMPVPLPQKPLKNIQASHRRRTRRKREFRESVVGQMIETSARALRGTP